MTQAELIIEYIKEFGQITPAKMSGTIYKDEMFGSEVSKRCRELRARGTLESQQIGKFEVFKLKEKKNLEIPKWKQRLSGPDERLRELLKRIPVKWENASAINEINNALKSRYEMEKQRVLSLYESLF